MEVDWDPKKAASNLAKHGVSFADAALALEDDLALTVREDARPGEDRFVSMAQDPLGRILVIVYAHRGDRLRIISARRASRAERRYYEEGS